MGIPIINFLCFVLWRMRSIITSIIAEPPSAARRKSSISGIRLPLFIARILSIAVNIFLLCNRQLVLVVEHERSVKVGFDIGVNKIDRSVGHLVTAVDGDLGYRNNYVTAITS